MPVGLCDEIISARMKEQVQIYLCFFHSAAQRNDVHACNCTVTVSKANTELWADIDID